MLTILYVLIAIHALWVHYVAIMNLDRARKAGKMTAVTWFLSAPILVIGLILDVVVHAVIGTLVFWDLPREWTLSQRLTRYFHGNGWRQKVAAWIGVVLLNPFDPEWDHIS